MKVVYLFCTTVYRHLCENIVLATINTNSIKEGPFHYSYGFASVLPARGCLRDAGRYICEIACEKKEKTIPLFAKIFNDLFQTSGTYLADMFSSSWSNPDSSLMITIIIVYQLETVVFVLDNEIFRVASQPVLVSCTSLRVIIIKIQREFGLLFLFSSVTSVLLSCIFNFS